MESGFTDLSEIKIKAFDLSPCPIIVVDKNLKILAVNEQATELFGYVKDTLMDRSLETLVPEAHRAEHLLQTSEYLKSPRKREMGSGRDLFARKRDGALFPVEIGLNPVYQEKTLFIIVSVLDISHRKALEKELTEKNAKLEEINRELNSFANVAAHDLKSPLHTITAFTALIRKKLSPDTDPSVLDFVERIKISSTRLEYLIEQLFEFSKIESAVALKERVSLETVLENVLSDLSEIIRQTGAQIASDPLPAVDGVEIHLYQIFQNVISNAIKFRKKEISPAIQIRVQDEDEQHVISFSDNGVGFDQKYIYKIFQPFERLVTADDVEGSGIGLATVKKLVERNGGSISATGKPGKGAVFTISLPKSGKR